MPAIRIPALLPLFCVLPGMAVADAPHGPPLKAGPAVSIAAYGRQNPLCAEWTNGCVVCTTADGHARCSTPGIACTPAGLTCKRQVKP